MTARSWRRGGSQFAEAGNRLRFAPDVEGLIANDAAVGSETNEDDGGKLEGAAARAVRAGEASHHQECVGFDPYDIAELRHQTVGERDERGEEARQLVGATP